MGLNYWGFLRRDCGMSRFTQVLLVAVMFIGYTAGVANAVSYGITDTVSFSDFESFTVGTSVNQYFVEADRGKDWSVDDEWVGAPGVYDEAIVAGGGNQAWRVSQASGTGGYSADPWSPSVAAVGEAGSFLWNDRGSDHTLPLSPPLPNGAPAWDKFIASFDFWSATRAVQPGLFLSVSPGPRQSSFRESYIGLDGDGTGGIDVIFYETDAAGGFTLHTVATGLDASADHNIRMEIVFRDGLNGDGSGNDEVSIYVDSLLALSGVTTWETYYRLATPVTPEVAVDSLFFNVAGGAPGTSGAGFVFDNVRLEAAAATAIPVPAAAWAGMMLIGGLGGFRSLRRKLHRA
jgi:hypothetical protein